MTCDPRSLQPGNCNSRVKPRPMPYTPPAPVTTTRNPCLRHQAPRGWRYVLVNGRCVLQNTVSRRILLPTTAAVVTPGNTIAGTASSVSNWIKNNKGLAAVIGGAIAYAIFKDK